MIMSQTALRGVQVVSLRNLRVEQGYQTGTVEQDGPYEIKRTESGVRCGNHGKTPKGERHTYHANRESVAACYALAESLRAEQEAEIAAEQGYERYLEDRGYWEARADEDREFWSGVSHY